MVENVKTSDYVMDSGRAAEAEIRRMKTNHSPEDTDKILSEMGVSEGDHVLLIGTCTDIEPICAFKKTRAPVFVVELNPDRARLGQIAINHWWFNVHNGEGECPIQMVCGDVMHLLKVIGDRRFHKAIAIRVLQYVEDPQEAVNQMAQAVQTGGRVAIYDLHGNCTQHGGMDAVLAQQLQLLMNTLEKRSLFHPNIGIELYSLLKRAGLRVARPKISTYHDIVGHASEKELANLFEKLQGAREVGEKLFGAVVYKEFVQKVQNFMLAGDTTTFSTAFLVVGERVE